MRAGMLISVVEMYRNSLVFWNAYRISSAPNPGREEMKMAEPFFSSEFSLGRKTG